MKLRYNLQTFAEDDIEKEEIDDVQKEAEDKEDKDEKKESKKPKSEPKDEPSTQELLNEIAKLKRAQEKASSDAAEWKKKYRATLSEKEQADIEKAEKEAEREERFANIERENQIYKITSVYLGMGYTADEANRIAVAEADNDFEAKTKIMSEVDARKVKELEAKFYAERPDVHAGSGSDVLTQERFDQMDMVEKTALRRSDPEAYNRFMGGK